MSSDEEVMPINAAFILEVIGKPKEHLVETLEGMTKKMSEEKGVKIIDQKINEPVPIEKHEGFFTSFAEIEVRVECMQNIMALIFKYMPAHVDIIEPENVKMSNNMLSEVLNELTRRLHGYDEIARVIQIEKKILENKLKAVLGEQKSGAGVETEAKDNAKDKTKDTSETASEDKKSEDKAVDKTVDNVEDKKE